MELCRHHKMLGHWNDSDYSSHGHLTTDLNFWEVFIFITRAHRLKLNKRWSHMTSTKLEGMFEYAIQIETNSYCLALVRKWRAFRPCHLLEDNMSTMSSGKQLLEFPGKMPCGPSSTVLVGILSNLSTLHKASYTKPWSCKRSSAITWGGME